MFKTIFGAALDILLSILILIMGVNAIINAEVYHDYGHACFQLLLVVILIYTHDEVSYTR